MQRQTKAEQRAPLHLPSRCCLDQVCTTLPADRSRSPVFSPALRTKAPWISLAAGGFWLADNLQSVRQTVNRQKVTVTVAVLCGSPPIPASCLFSAELVGGVLKMADMFSARYRLCKGTKSISTVSKDIGGSSGGKRPCVLLSQLLDRPTPVTQRWPGELQGQTLAYGCYAH